MNAMNTCSFSPFILYLLLLPALAMYADTFETEQSQVPLDTYMTALNNLRETWVRAAGFLDEKYYAEATETMKYTPPPILKRYHRHHSDASKHMNGVIKHLKLYDLWIPTTETYSLLGAPDLAARYFRKLEQADKLYHENHWELYIEALVASGNLPEALRVFNRLQPNTIANQDSRYTTIVQLSAFKTVALVDLVEKYYLPNSSVGTLRNFGVTIACRVWASALPQKTKVSLLVRLFNEMLDRTGQLIAMRDLLQLPDATNDAATADLAFDTAEELYRDGFPADALRLWNDFIEWFPSHENWGKAVFNSGIALGDINQPQKAITMFSRLFNSPVNDREPGVSIMEIFRNYRHRACLEIATCYENMLDFTQALTYVILSRDTYPFQSFCGTCDDEEELCLKQRIALLTELAKRTGRDTNVVAQTAVSMLVPSGSYAQRILEKLGAPAVPYLIAALSDTNANCRLAAAETLGKLGPCAIAAAHVLVRMLKDPVDSVKFKAASALGRLGVNDAFVVRALIEGLNDTVIRSACKSILAILPPNPENSYLVGSMLADVDEKSRIVLFKILGRLGPQAGAAVPFLIDEYRALPTNIPRGDVTALYTLSETLIQIGAPTVPALAELLISSGDSVQYRIIDILNRIGPDAKAAVPALITIAANPSYSTSYKASFTLQKIGGAVDHLPCLIQAVNNEATPTRTRSLLISLIGSIGPEANEAIPVLVDLTANTNTFVRQSAILALGHLGSNAVPRLVELLNHPDPAIQACAARSIVPLGPAALPALPNLIQNLQYQNRSLLASTVDALGSIGPEARDALPFLKQSLEKPCTDSEYINVLMTVWRISGNTEETVRELIRIVENDTVANRVSAIEALGSMGPAAKKAVYTLRGFLACDKQYIREAANKALEKINNRPSE